jgi:hypothetical protein
VNNQVPPTRQAGRWFASVFQFETAGSEALFPSAATITSSKWKAVLSFQEVSYLEQREGIKKAILGR